MLIRSLVLAWVCLIVIGAAEAADFIYATNSGAITITGYTGSGGAITVPNTITGLRVTSIADAAFWGTTSITSLTVPGTITNIGQYAFYFCTRLSSINILEGVSSIGQSAFQNCGLTNVTLPDTLTTLSDRLFINCGALTNITIGSGVTNIGAGVFAYCFTLTAINVSALNSVYSSLAGVLFDRNQTSIIQFPPGKAGAYLIPDGVTDIAYGTFFRLY